MQDLDNKNDLQDAVYDLYNTLKERVGIEIRKLILGEKEKEKVKKNPRKKSKSPRDSSPKKAAPSAEQMDDDLLALQALTTAGMQAKTKKNQKAKKKKVQKRAFDPPSGITPNIELPNAVKLNPNVDISPQSDVYYLALLLSNWGDPQAVDYVDPETGTTALHLCAQKGKSDLAIILINKGARLDIQDKLGNTPLFEACKNGYLNIASALLAAGADFSIVNNFGNSPLSASCRNGFKDVIDLLLGQGADPFVRNAKGETAIDRIKMAPLKEAVTVMVQRVQTRMEQRRSNGKSDYESIPEFQLRLQKRRESEDKGHLRSNSPRKPKESELAKKPSSKSVK
eukprot:TRINITY_DN747_c0_g1_i1.p1 TRINITY_DN747_c0_g1~~TRINITY_DN747_c0_g1_i1.p1  ORF type:complete len:340 (-),score=79.87 TRINITY_DN747_c0_g1_i1:85-1104(-)